MRTSRKKDRASRLALAMVAMLAWTALAADDEEDKARQARALMILPPGAIWAPAGVVVGPVIVYKPVVDYIPIGATVQGTAVVSPDLRYVTVNMGAQSTGLNGMRALNVGPIPPGGSLRTAGADAVAAPPLALDADYAVAANQAGLSLKQRDAVAAILQARAVAESRWDLENGAVLCDLERRRNRASGTERQELTGRIRELQAGRVALSAACNGQIADLMTSPQRARWNACLLAKALEDELARLNLRAEQRAELRRLCAKAAEGYESRGDITDDAAVRDACLQEMYRAVLDEAQRKAYDRPDASPAPASQPNPPA